MPTCTGFVMEKISSTEAIMYGGLIAKSYLSTDIFIVRIIDASILVCK